MQYIEYCLLKHNRKQKLFLLYTKNKNNAKKTKRIKAKTKKIITLQNKNNATIPFGVDKVVYCFNYNINYFKYYLELYFSDLLIKHNNIKNNKINL